jgi:PqqD family protein of HPr-rel-A system
MTAPMRPRARDDLAVVELDGEAVIYDERSGNLHHLNPTATVVFSLCDGNSTIKEMARDIGEAFEVPPADVEKQLRQLIRDFQGSELLDGVSTNKGNGNGKDRR